MKHRKPMEEPNAQDVTADSGKRAKKVKKKKFGPVKTSICIVTTAAVLAVGTWACIAFTRPQVRNDVAEDYGSVCFEVKDGEVFSEGAFVPLKERDENDAVLSGDVEGTYDAVDVFGRLNYVFQQQNNWYSEMHSKVQTAVGVQNVETYKRYSDGILISSDITTSSLVNDAREYCYIGDRVIWRESSVGKDKWDGLNTQFSDGSPEGNMQISGEEGFKKRNGLPATELSVYVIKGATVESAELQSDGAAATADGTKLYTVVYHLRAKTDEAGSTGAAAYYGNQMVFSGGIDAPPTFEYITLSFTFTEDWYPVSCEVDESYTATMKTIVSTCSSHSRTEYNYGVKGLDEEVKDIYEDYYKQYAALEATGEAERPLTATECLAGAFSPMLSGPSNLDVDLSVNGKEMRGSVYLDLGDALDGDFGRTEMRLRLGDLLGVWVERGTAYLSYGEMKFAIDLDTLMGLISSASPQAENTSEGGADDILASLADGEFTCDETSAQLHSVLSLGDAQAAIGFYFSVDAERNITLDRVEATLNYSDMEISIRAAFAQDGPAPLTFMEKARFIDVGAYAEKLKQLFTSENLGVNAFYENSDLGLSVRGEADVSLTDGTFGGNFMLSYGGVEKPVGVFFDGETVYVDLDGMKFQATITEIITLIMQYMPASDIVNANVSLSLADLVGALLDSEFADNFLSEKEGNALVLTLRGTQILEALGLGFSLGDVSVSVTERDCTIKALGAEVTLTEGISPVLPEDLDTYVDIMPTVNTVLGLIENNFVTMTLNYQGDVGVTAEVNLDINNLNLTADVTVSYGENEKHIVVGYVNAERNIYLTIDGLKVKVSIDEIESLVGGLLPQTTSETDETVLALLENLADFVQVGKGESGGLKLTLALDAILGAFHVDMGTQLGEGIIEEKNGTFALTLLNGALTAEIKKGVSFEVDTTDYTEVLPYAMAIYDMIASGNLNIALSYENEEQGIAVSGTVELGLEPIVAMAKLKVSYQGVEKDLRVTYSGRDIYLLIDGLKLKANLDDITEILQLDTTAAQAQEFDLAQILGIVFSVDLSNILTTLKNGENTLEVTLALDEFITALGFDTGDFLLGNANITVTGDSVTLSALGAEVILTAGTSPVIPNDLGTYVDVMPTVNAVLGLIENNFVTMTLNYQGDVGVTGEVKLDINNLNVSADLTVSYGENEKHIVVGYVNAQKNIYLTVDGLKIKASVDEIESLIATLLPQTTSETDETILALLENLADLVQVGKGESGGLKLTLALDAILGAFHVDLGTQLGQGIIEEKNGTFALTLLNGALTADVAKGDSFAVDTTDYTEVLPYVMTIYEMIASGNLNIALSYENEAQGIKVSGTVKLALEPIIAVANLTVSYQGVTKDLTVTYSEREVYLLVDDLKLKANIDEITEILQLDVPDAQAQEIDLAQILGMVFSVDLSNILTMLKNSENSLEIELALDELITALGFKTGDFLLGNARITVTENDVTLSALGAEVTLSEGTAPVPMPEEEVAAYIDAKDLLIAVSKIVEAKGVSFGETDLTLFHDGNEQLAVYLENAGISWKEGFAFRGDVVFSVNSVNHRISVYADTKCVQLAYGNLSANIVYDDFARLQDAFNAVKEELKSFIEAILGTTVEEAGDDLLSALTLAEGGGALSGFVGGISEFVKNLQNGSDSFNVANLLNGLLLGMETDAATGRKLTVTLNGESESYSLKLGLSSDGSAVSLSFKLPVQDGSDAHEFTLLGEIQGVCPLDALKAMPADVTTLGTDEFINIIGYFGSAVSLLNTTDLTLTFSGNVTSSETQYEEFGGVKYEIDAQMQTHRGAGDLIHLDLKGKNLWVDSGVYAHASVNVAAKSAADQSVFIDMYILDGAPENISGDIVFDENTTIESLAKDDNLDFYVTLSQFGPANSTAETVQGYDPVRLYAPATEILPLLSAALPLLGVDVEILNNYMVNKWLTPESVAQFKALGGIVQPLLGGLLGKDETGSDAPAVAVLDEASDNMEFDLRDYLTELSVGNEGLNIVLNSETLYGIEGLAPVTAKLTKAADTFDEQGNFAKDENGHYAFGKFQSLDLCNIYDKTGKNNTTLYGEISYGTIEPSIPTGNYQSFLGADKLLEALARSATHVVEGGDVITGEETPHTYAVNTNFYIDGSITANMFSIVNATIDLVAISVTVDENGALGINIRLKYQGIHLLLSAIQGDSTVDITIKNNMVFMKRVQTSITHSVFNNEILDTPIVLYRAMTLENFTGDMLGQLGFILNFGDMINNAIQSGDADTGTTTPPTTEKVDFGTTLHTVLSSYTFTEGEERDTWDLKINGESFSNGILGSLRAVISADKDGYIREITLPADDMTVINIPAGRTSLALKLSASLKWHNPGGIMEDGVTNQTQDLTEEVGGAEKGMGGMIQKLNAVDETTGLSGWQDDPATPDVREGTAYLEAKPFTVTYSYNNYGGGTTQLGTQEVMVSTGADGNPANTLYTALMYPSLPDGSAEFSYGRTADEIQIGGLVPSDGNIVFGEQTKNLYTVTFRSEYDFGNGWELNEDYYLRSFDMEYGAKVTIGIKEYTVTDVDTEFYVLLADATVGVREGHWGGAPEFTPQGVAFVPEIEGDAIVYNSEIAFTMEGAEGSVQSYETTYMADYALKTPSANGYTFLGWFTRTETGWEQVENLLFDPDQAVQSITVEALWVSNLTVEITKADRHQTSSSWGIRYYDYTVTANIHGGKLFGAFAEEATVSMNYVFNAYSSGWLGGTDKITQNDYSAYTETSTGQGNIRQRDEAQVIVTITYTYGEFTRTEQETVTRSWNTV